MKVFKVFMGGCLGVIIFFFIVISFFIKLGKIENKQAEAIRNFPVIEGKLYTKDPIVTPISGEMAAAVLIESTGNYQSVFSTAASDDSLQTKEFFFVSKNLQIEVDGKIYELVGNTIDAYVKGGEETEITDCKNIIDDCFVGIDNILDANFKNLGCETKSGPIEVDSDYKSYNVKEFVFKNGSSIQIKGRIEGQQVIVLTWEDAN